MNNEGQMGGLVGKDRAPRDQQPELVPDIAPSSHNNHCTSFHRVALLHGIVDTREWTTWMLRRCESLGKLSYDRQTYFDTPRPPTAQCNMQLKHNHVELLDSSSLTKAFLRLPQGDCDP